MSSKSNFMMKKKSSLALLVLLLSSLFLSQVTPSKANNKPTTANQLVFPLYYKGEGISTDSAIESLLIRGYDLSNYGNMGDNPHREREVTRLLYKYKP